MSDPIQIALPEISSSRRRVIRTLSCGLVGGLMASGSAMAAPFSRKAPAVVTGGRIDLTDLPPEWAAAQGRELKNYALYLASMKFQRVTVRQVIKAHAKEHGGVWNSLPPRSHWKYLVPTLRVIDRLSLEMGVEVDEVVSAYRSPAYNRRCAGARSGSWHQANVAVDVKFATAATTVATTARTMRSRGLFRGGVGRYSSFTHIDTRGQNIDW